MYGVGDGVRMCSSKLLIMHHFANPPPTRYIVKACLVGGLYPRLARVDRDKTTLYTRNEEGLEVHNESVLNVITTSE